MLRIIICLILIIVPGSINLSAEDRVYLEHKIYDKEARVTCYNDYGTMANGETTEIGMVAVSDRSIPMNTLVFIQGYGIMKIADKTAAWVHNKYGLTFDIYDPNCSKKFGVKKLHYEIQKEPKTLE